MGRISKGGIIRKPGGSCCVHAEVDNGLKRGHAEGTEKGGRREGEKIECTD